jgi:hypothetical protein
VPIGTFSLAAISLYDSPSTCSRRAVWNCGSREVSRSSTASCWRFTSSAWCGSVGWDGALTCATSGASSSGIVVIRPSRLLRLRHVVMKALVRMRDSQARALEPCRKLLNERNAFRQVS